MARARRAARRQQQRGGRLVLDARHHVHLGNHVAAQLLAAPLKFELGGAVALPDREVQLADAVVREDREELRVAWARKGKR